MLKVAQGSKEAVLEVCVVGKPNAEEHFTYDLKDSLDGLHTGNSFAVLNYHSEHDHDGQVESQAGIKALGVDPIQGHD